MLKLWGRFIFKLRATFAPRRGEFFSPDAKAAI